MRFGFHISISGGFSKVAPRANAKNCDTLQLFARNPRRWKVNSLDPKDVGTFKEDMGKSDIHPLFIHVLYLSNLATPDLELQRKSVDSLVLDLEIAKQLGIKFLIIHVGSRGESTLEEAVRRVSSGINEAFNRTSNGVSLLLENSAGGGTKLGGNLTELSQIIEGVENRDRIGICLDTAHAFEAGYDLSTEEGLAQTLTELDGMIGLEKLKLLHLNDSKTPLNSHSDRHWHIGDGYIGLEGFRRIINHPYLSSIPGIMETPRHSDDDDMRNMRVIRSLVNNELP